MKDHNMRRDTEWDAFMKKVLKEASEEGPPKDFTSAVMKRVAREKAAAEKVTRPLISGFIWGMLFLGLAALAVLAITGKIDMEVSWFNMTWDLPDDFVRYLNFAPLSKTLWYGGIALVVAIYVQIYIVKSYFDRRYFMN